MVTQQTHSQELDETKVPAELQGKARSAFLKQKLQETGSKGALFGQIAQYMFWGATTLLALTVGAPFFSGGEGLSKIAEGIGTSTGLILTGLGVASAATLAGSLYFSQKSALAGQSNGILYSKQHAMHIAGAIRREGEMRQQEEAKNMGEPRQNNWAATVASRTKPAEGSWAEYATAQQIAHTASTRESR